MGDAELLRKLEAQEERMRAVVQQLLTAEPDAVIPWTGRLMAVVKFVPHLRNEFAIHRWDFAGDDEVGYDRFPRFSYRGAAYGRYSSYEIAAVDR